MFHNPSADDLNAQMTRQRAVVDVWSHRLGMDRTRVRHVLLLPQRLADRERSGLVDPVVTWEQVLEDYWTVAPRYWAGVLHRALINHEALETATTHFQGNADELLTGAEIVARHATGELHYDHVGRQGGRWGSRFTADLATGKWRTTRYEVRTGGSPNRNWFPITDFRLF